MALKELYDASVGQNDFWKQVAGACMVAAMDISKEAPSTPNHANRILWAISVRDNVKLMARTMLISVLKDPTIAADVNNAADADVQDVVNSLVDTFATG